MAGVTERTIYKYAAKHGWKPRYRWALDRSWRAGAAFAPVKGASARFIRRDDQGQPVATGLKATDPAGAARAQAACGEAGQIAAEAQRQAEAAQRQAQQAQRAEATIRAIEWTSRALRQLNDYLAARDKHGNLKRDWQRDRQRDLRQYPGARRYRPRPDRVELVLTQAANAALSRWEVLLKEEAQVHDVGGADQRGAIGKSCEAPRAP